MNLPKLTTAQIQKVARAEAQDGWNYHHPAQSEGQRKALVDWVSARIAKIVENWKKDGRLSDDLDPRALAIEAVNYTIDKDNKNGRRNAKLSPGQLGTGGPGQIPRYRESNEFVRAFRESHRMASAEVGSNGEKQRLEKLWAWRATQEQNVDAAYAAFLKNRSKPGLEKAWLNVTQAWNSHSGSEATRLAAVIAALQQFDNVLAS